MNYWLNVKTIILILILANSLTTFGQESRIVDFEADYTDFDQDLGSSVFRLSVSSGFKFAAGEEVSNS